MPTKPTYRALKKRIKTLEQEIRRLNLKLSHLNTTQSTEITWLESSPICNKIVDLNYNLQYMSTAGIDSLKIEDISEYYGKPYPFSFYPESFKSSMISSLDKAVQSGQVVTQEEPVLDLDNNELWFHSTIVPVFNDNNDIQHLIIVSVDTTAKKRAEQALIHYNQMLEETIEERTSELQEEIKQQKEIEKQITHIATHDALTQLPNRYLLVDRLNQSCAWARRNDAMVAVLFIDLDGFKPINDEFGHRIGDEVLIETTNRMAYCLRETDTVARYGGDEFIVIMTDVKSRTDVDNMANILCASIRAPISIDDCRIMISSSIGICLYPENGVSPQELISQADKAMYEVKRNGKNGYQFSSSSTKKVFT